MDSDDKGSRRVLSPRYVFCVISIIFYFYYLLFH